MTNKIFTLSNEKKVIRDPIHSYIHIELQIILDLINTPCFQRLRRIKQLGATYTVYPTANHTRFDHSLGVYEIARRLVTENEEVANNLTDNEKVYVQIAALLHDLGHGPYSHVFESITNINHEQMTNQFILQDTQVHTILENYQQGLSQIICDIINHNYPKKLCWQLVSSQLDADRMDYLLRDAYFTGTKYGEFDLERIMRTIKVHNNQLVVKQSGIYALEDYLMSRFHMFWQVYYHVNIRMFERMFEAFALRIETIKEKYPDDYFLGFDKLIHANTIDTQLFLNYDDSSIIELFKKLQYCNDTILADLSGRLLNRQFFNEYELSKENKTMLLKKLQGKGLDPTYYLLQDNHGKTTNRPYNSSGKQKINILKNDGTIAEFTQVSTIMNSLSSANETNDNKYYCCL